MYLMQTTLERWFWSRTGALGVILVGGMMLGCGEVGGAGGNATIDQATGTGSGPAQGVGPAQGGTGTKQATGASGGQTTGLQDPDTATLTWDANSEADLAGYKVYHSEESQVYTLGMPEAEVAAGTTMHVVPNLSPGRHYFAVTAYDGSGNESALSMEVFKDIP